MEWNNAIARVWLAVACLSRYANVTGRRTNSMVQISRALRPHGTADFPECYLLIMPSGCVWKGLICRTCFTKSVVSQIAFPGPTPFAWSALPAFDGTT